MTTLRGLVVEGKTALEGHHPPKRGFFIAPSYYLEWQIEILALLTH